MTHAHDETAPEKTMSNPVHDRYLALQAETPHLFARDAAKRLGVSEAELVAAMPSTLRLEPRVPEIFARLASAGEVKVITRNENAVIEKWGRFEGVEIGSDHAGQVVGEEIDLRVFPRRFRSGFFVTEESARTGKRESLQFFDEHGDSVVKVYAESEETAVALRVLAADHVAERKNEALAVAPPPAPAARVALSPADVEAFRSAWDAMTDTHEMFGILRRFQLGRVQGLEAAGPERAREVERDALVKILGWAAEKEQPIMVFVGSRGVIQIHTGPVRTVKAMSGYLNVLDRRFNLHVKEGSVARAFVVKKPTADGTVTSLELFDAQDETIALVFSKRKPGQVEGEAWRGALAGLAAAESA